MNTLYVDPGKDWCAIAGFIRDNRLTYVRWHLTSDGAIQSIAPARAIVELPVPRPGARHKQLCDLIDLAAAAGRVAGNMPVRYITPESWKGQTPCTCTAKTHPEQCTHHRRMWAALDERERDLLFSTDCPKGKLHNIYDAVTMGLKLEGRLNVSSQS